MAGKVTVKQNKASTKPYKVSGSTLAEIWTDIKAKGPKDGGKDRAGYTQAPVTSAKTFNYDGKVKQDKKKNEYNVEVWMKEAAFTCDPEIQHPSLTSDKDLSAKAKKEWKRFYGELMSHENEHVTTTIEATKKFGAELIALVGKGTDADKEKAKEKAQEDWTKQRDKDKLDDAELKKRLKKANADLDSGGHGPVLDTSIV